MSKMKEMANNCMKFRRIAYVCTVSITINALASSGVMLAYRSLTLVAALRSTSKVVI